MTARMFAEARDVARKGGQFAHEGCGFVDIPRLQLVRMPNSAWLDFMSGPLTADDWTLIGRVERGEIGVDEAMEGRL